MAKTATATVTKAATRRAVEKPTKAAKADKADKPKRPPSAYNLFVQAQMKPWLEANKDKSVKEAMVEIGALWREAPENPNRGKAVTTRKPKAPKEAAPKAKATKAKKAKAPAKEEESASSEVEQAEENEDELES